MRRFCDKYNGIWPGTDITGTGTGMKLVAAIQEEIRQKVSAEIHPKISALTSAFVAYLKEPRYLSPLTISELASLFTAFYNDLYGLVFNIYAQLTLCKRQLIQNSALFANDLATYDYLNAIAHYSSSHLKFVKRSDAQTAYQLRVFGFYKAVIILESIEAAQAQLFTSVTPGDQTQLYYKIFQFDLRDIILQDLLTEKLSILSKLSLPLSAFCEAGVNLDSASLDDYFSTLPDEAGQTLECIKNYMVQLDQARSPYSKARMVVKIQTSLIDLCAGHYNNDSSKVSNDILLPALIFIIIYHPARTYDGKSINLYLNFCFVKHFCHVLDPYHATASSFNQKSSLTSYTPTERKESLIETEKLRTHNFFELINLKNSNEVTNKEAEPEFTSDKALISFIQRTYFNTGELQYYLTNFEAILYFLMNTPIKDIVPLGYTIPEALLQHDILTLSLHQVLESRESKEQEHDETESEYTSNQTEEHTEYAENAARSRSSSLFSTISTAVTQTMNRSRSNSGALKSQSKKTNVPSFEASLTQTLTPGDNYGLTPVKKFLGRIGQASAVLGENGPISEGEHLENRLKRSSLLSPGHSITCSGSVEIPSFLHSPNLRKPSLTNKLLNGVSELMTKFNVAPSVSTHNLSSYEDSSGGLKNSSREDSLEDCNMTRKPHPQFGGRTSSMEKWIKKFGEPSEAQTYTNSQIDSAYNYGSLFSAPFEELTRYHLVDFDTLTMLDMKNLKFYYDQLCSELLALKVDSKTSNEQLPPEEIAKEHRSI